MTLKKLNAKIAKKGLKKGFIASQLKVCKQDISHVLGGKRTGPRYKELQKQIENLVK